MFNINLEKRFIPALGQGRGDTLKPLPNLSAVAQESHSGFTLHVPQRRIKACQGAGPLGGELVLPGTRVCHVGDRCSLPPPQGGSSFFLTTSGSLFEGNLIQTLFSRDLKKNPRDISVLLTDLSHWLLLSCLTLNLAL